MLVEYILPPTNGNIVGIKGKGSDGAVVGDGRPTGWVDIKELDRISILSNERSEILQTIVDRWEPGGDRWNEIVMLGVSLW